MSTRNLLVSSGDAIDQAERDRLPDHDTARGRIYERPARRALDWRVVLALIVGLFLFGSYVLLRVAEWVADTSYQTRWIDVYLIAGLKIALFAAPLTFLAIGGYWLYSKARSASIVRLQNNMPVAARHIQHDTWQAAAIGSLGAFYEVEKAWAEHSAYRSLNQLDLSRSFTGIKPDAIDVSPINAAPLLPIAPNEGPMIEQLRAKGYINRSP